MLRDEIAQRKDSHQLKDAVRGFFDVSDRDLVSLYFCLPIADGSPLVVLNMGCQSQLNIQEEEYTFWGKVMIVTP